MRSLLNSKAAIAARQVLNECGLDNPIELPIEDIVLSRKGMLEVQSITIHGAQGRIMFDGEDAIISYSNDIAHEGKRRFVIAHELGHFELHKDLLEAVHMDDEKNLSEWYAKGKHEHEANQFAAEFLMPSEIFRNIVEGKRFSFDLIKEVSETFQTSLTASVLRYRILGDFPIAVIFCNDSKVEWSDFSHDFVLQYVPRGMEVPVNTIAYDFYKRRELPNEPELIEVEDWFSQDYKMKHCRDINFYEQCIRIGQNGILSCVWND